MSQKKTAHLMQSGVLIPKGSFKPALIDRRTHVKIKLAHAALTNE
jgi:hypothetical protein